MRNDVADATVAICTYAPERRHDLERAVRSVFVQTLAPREIVVLVDGSRELLEWARARWCAGRSITSDRSVRVVANTHARGLAGARNTALETARTDIVAFLDDDAEAADSWLERLLAPYADDRTVAVGGRVDPAFASSPPGWWPHEFDWVVGCAHPGLPSEPSRVRNVIGANMSTRRSAALDAGGFSEGLGRVGRTPVGCEETELCIRLTSADPDARVVYEPSAVVRHRVPADRLSWRYFGARCYGEGMSKALVARRVGANRALSTERRYALRVLPKGFAGGIASAVRGDGNAAARASAIAVGLALTTAGYVRGRLAAQGRDAA